MTNEPALMTSVQQAAIVEQVVLHGDLAKLTPEQRVKYYQAVCQSVGVNPLTKPFDYITLNGKLTLYATRTCTDQIRANTKISISIVSREVLDDIYVVTARGEMPDGRTDESTGAVNIANLKGEAKANAYMKCETKSKRRLTLSMAGLGWMDESEVESVPTAKTLHVNMETGEIETPSSRPPLTTPKAETPKAQHPLIAAGFTAATIRQLAAWIGGNQAAKDWSADQRATAKSVTEALLSGVQDGLTVEALNELLADYGSLDGSAVENAAALVSHIAQMGSLRMETETGNYPDLAEA